MLTPDQFAEFLKTNKFTFFESTDPTAFQKLVDKKYTLFPLAGAKQVYFYEYPVKCPAMVQVDTERKLISTVVGVYSKKPNKGVDEIIFDNVCKTASENSERLQNDDIIFCLSCVIFLIDLQPEKDWPEICLDMSYSQDFPENFSTVPPIGVRKEEMILVKKDYEIDYKDETIYTSDYFLFINDSSNAAGGASFYGNSKFLTKPEHPVTSSGISVLFYANALVESVEVSELLQNQVTQLASAFSPKEQSSFIHKIVKTKELKDKERKNLLPPPLILPNPQPYTAKGRLKITDFLARSEELLNLPNGLYYVDLDIMPDYFPSAAKVTVCTYRPQEKSIFIKFETNFTDKYKETLAEQLEADFFIEFKIL